MKKSFLLLIVILICTQLAIAQSANNTRIDFTPLGDFYTGYRQSLVSVNGVTYSDGISNHFHKAASPNRYTATLQKINNSGFYLEDKTQTTKPGSDIPSDDAKNTKALIDDNTKKVDDK